ncbi:MAG: metallophosphoesterase family protein [Bacillota bacterium]
MKTAFISDIHGNLHALETVLKDIGARGVSRVYCAGDLVGYGPRPGEVIEMIRKKGIPTVMGNYDDAVGNMRLICGCDYKDEESLRLGESSMAWTRDNTAEDCKKWLRELPAEIKIEDSGLNMLLVHGSPRSLNEYLYEDIEDSYLNELLEESGADVIVCGHTHLPYARKLSGGYIVNAGSVGKPKGGSPNATYIIVNADGKGLSVEIAEVPYDYEKTAGEIERSGLPHEFAQVVRTGMA